MRLIFAALLGVALASPASGEERKLRYVPAPPDNPLKGFVPYVDIDARERFPHSLEFHYFSLKELMTGPDAYDWSPLEDKLALTQARGCQLIFRVFLEYPGRSSQIPDFLLDAGVEVTVWTSPDGKESETPDYEDPRLQAALRRFVVALGRKYDGDPRIGFLTAGLLGSWGEWHNYPRSDLWASKDAQRLVLDAFAESFVKTPVLLRYPAGEDHGEQAGNADRPFGYHDDSFAWATLPTGREEDSWFFVPLLERAGAAEKWKSQPIGGEVRPELWETSFTAHRHPRSQDFHRCLSETHVTWLMDTGLFAQRFPLPAARKEAAIRAAQAMGYEFFVSSCRRAGDALSLTVENRGVAPFYHDWPVELSGGEGILARFDLRGILPGESRIWEAEVSGDGPFRLRVPNPMDGGRPLRFANAEQGEEWLTLP